ncbi:hypothetical protein EDD18DRAFT_1127460 [Armillaria luteobubalina]|uniref:Secreted protein n=1 Tax=Armillaria luteobubalina TaxID=153913 RepID=A0AA39U0A9_9AGAR|nr:hypothetical protein EDD18DRAFT_1127460 [Armillaria luteobubalina]
MMLSSPSVLLLAPLSAAYCGNARRPAVDEHSTAAYTNVRSHRLLSITISTASRLASMASGNRQIETVVTSVLFVFSRRRGAPRGSHTLLRYGRNVLRCSICYPLGSCSEIKSNVGRMISRCPSINAVRLFNYIPISCVRHNL